MSKKHYTAIADVVQEAMEIAADEGYSTPLDPRSLVEQIARDLAVEFRNDNPRFDRGKFLKACGVE
jgi:hypothetical protein